MQLKGTVKMAGLGLSLRSDSKGRGLRIWTSGQGSWGGSPLAPPPANGGMGGSLALLQTWLLGPSDDQ